MNAEVSGDIVERDINLTQGDQDNTFFALGDKAGDLIDAITQAKHNPQQGIFRNSSKAHMSGDQLLAVTVIICRVVDAKLKKVRLRGQVFFTTPSEDVAILDVDAITHFELKEAKMQAALIDAMQRRRQELEAEQWDVEELDFFGLALTDMNIEEL